MENNNEIQMEQAKPEQKHDFLRMLEAFKMINEAIAKHETLYEQKPGEQETDQIIEKVISGKGLQPNNPFLRDAKTEDELETSLESAKSFVKRNMKNGHFEFPKQEEYEKKMDTAKPDEKTTDEQAKKAATDDEAFKKVANAKTDFENNKTHEELYIKTILEILDTKAGGPLPDPSKYFWACEQLKIAEKLEYRVIESETGKQMISFKVKFKGQEEKIFKTIDFKKQKDIAPINPLDIKDLDSAVLQQRDANMPKETESNSPGQPEKPKAQEQLAPNSEKITKMNRDSSSLFTEIKNRLGYNKDQNAENWKEMTNNRQVMAQVLITLRDTPGIDANKADDETGVGK